MTLPPEVISALIHAGPGSESLIYASAAWQQLAVDLEDAAQSYTATVSSMGETWYGPSSAAMNQSIAPYLSWLRTTSQQAQQVAVSAHAAATAFNATSATVIPTAVVLANRAQLAHLLATNIFGINMPAIAANEAAYQEMWATNAAAMTRYQTASAQATTPLPQFTAPTSTTNPSGRAAQASSATPAATAASAGAATSGATSAQTGLGGLLSQLNNSNTVFGPNSNLYNTIFSSGFPINLLSYLAQNQSAQALQGVSAGVSQGVSEGENAFGGAAQSLGGGAAGALGALGQAGGGLSALGGAGLSAPTAAAATGVAIPMGGLSVPPGAGALLATSQAPVQLASAATPLGTGATSMMPPLMAPPISPGSGWKKRKPQKYDDISIGKEYKGNVMKPPPSAG